MGQICDRLDQLKPGTGPYRELITNVRDRPGNDRRYAIDSSMMKIELGWQPAHRFETGIEAGLGWYLDNLTWRDWDSSGESRHYLEAQYGQ